LAASGEFKAAQDILAPLADLIDEADKFLDLAH
jgi:hypothetical protein